MSLSPGRTLPYKRMTTCFASSANGSRRADVINICGTGLQGFVAQRVLPTALESAARLVTWWEGTLRGFAPSDFSSGNSDIFPVWRKCLLSAHAQAGARSGFAAAHLGELGAPEGHVLRGSVQSANALLQRQQALVDLRALQPRLPAGPGPGLGFFPKPHPPVTTPCAPSSRVSLRGQNRGFRVFFRPPSHNYPGYQPRWVPVGSQSHWQGRQAAVKKD